MEEAVQGRILDNPNKEIGIDINEIYSALNLNEQALREDEAARWRCDVDGRWPLHPQLPEASSWMPIFNLCTGEISGSSITVATASESPPTMTEKFFTIPPGFERGAHFDCPRDFHDLDEEEDGNVSSSASKGKKKVTLSMADLLTDLSEFSEKKIESIPKEASTAEKDSKSEDTVDKLIPPSSTTDLLQQMSIKSSVKSETPKTWAHMVNPNCVPADYDVVVKESLMTFPFTLDPFQKQSIYHLERGDNVFVAAHTSAGKTVVAEWAISRARAHFTKAIYTSPIKALSNQKFRDFRATFGEEAVGLVTGDVQVNPTASVLLLMTTEILRSMLYRQAEIIGEVEVVIFDEVHYINDADRGVVWEEVIIMLPPTVQLVLLSATIPNTMEFASWVGRTHRGRPVHVVGTSHRPVPLEHYLYIPKNTSTGGTTSGGSTPLVKIIDSESRFLENGYKEALQRRQSRNRAYGQARMDKGQWIDVVYHLRKNSLLPVVVFVFSRRLCEENAKALANFDLTTASEKSAIHLFLEHAVVSKLRPIDRTLPQILRLREMLSRGLAVHHSGLLPLLKEAVEILFGRGLVRVLFATETFAMGVNMPARTVIFSSITKHDGMQRRILFPTEYTQMAGRAGRRGIDATGTVIIMAGDMEDLPSDLTLRQMILGRANKLVSQFRLTYSMILNLLRVQALRIEEMIKASFSEHAGQVSLPAEEKRLQMIRGTLDTTPVLECSLCEEEMNTFYETAGQLARNNRLLYARISEDKKLAEGIFQSGRLLLVRNHPGSNIPAILLGVFGQKLSIFTLTNKSSLDDKEANRSDSKLELRPPPLPPTMISWPDIKSKLGQSTRIIDFSQLVEVLDVVLPVPSNLGSTTIYRPADLDGIQDEMIAFLSSTTITTTTIGKSHLLELEPFRSLDLESRRITRNDLIRRLSSWLMPCPQLMQHFLTFHNQSQLVEQLAELEFQVSDASLALLPEYRARLDLLHQLGYVDAQGTVTVKGRVAGELATVHELLVTELLFENAFAELLPGEIVALLSALVFQERRVDDSNGDELEEILTGNLLLGWQRISSQAQRLTLLAQEVGLTTSANNEGSQQQFNLVRLLCPALIETVHGWAAGLPFVQLMERTAVLEGSIVRCIVRLDETCRELRGAARIMGDPVLAAKMEEASRLVKRDICFAASLYL